MSRKIKMGAALLAVAVVLIIFVPRTYFRNSNAHLTIDGRVNTDFKLYFGPSDRLLLRIGAKNTRNAFVYVPQRQGSAAEVRECGANGVLFPPFTAITKRAPSACSVVNEQYLAVRHGNGLAFRTRDGHIYEVTWQAPNR
jgi:hypothetical protein